MYTPWEQSEILSGIESILFNLRHIPIQDAAFYLVKFSPEMADELAMHINAHIIERGIIGD